MTESCSIEVYVQNAFHTGANVLLLGERRDSGAASLLDYDLIYVEQALGARDCRAVSVRHPVTYEHWRCTGFPAFLMDMLPQGEARREVVAKLRRDGLPTSDWHVLQAGARNPVGNLRVSAAVTSTEESLDGVELAEIVARGDAFRAWAESQRIPMTGSSDTGGASPKLLMTADPHGRLHADGALPDARAHQHYILKFPRGRTRQDGAVLANEAPYLEVLRALGLRCGQPLRHVDGTLVVPRFDRRRVGSVVQRLGMESAYSVMGVIEPGARLLFEELAVAFAAVVDDPRADLLELLLRDVAALALGNPDNHGRNTSLLKHADGRVELSPVYDFAPMFLDPDLITRQTRWESERGGPPDWNHVVTGLALRLPAVVPREVTAPALRAFGVRLSTAAQLMREAGVDADVVTRRERAIADTCAALAAVEGG
ncbi:MAG: HipA domain-containing protein [Sandaracinaceae bacterium]|nr:HipA domain-containing protein [Sandaracinaceae bacterium]MBK8410215.1 HipA domain-containing protein [Sandaracinaceae bacterium]MBP7685824.1 HipA domain-containing protein [Deltaproteobacteria bacterium]